MKSIGAISSLFTLPSKEVWNIENGLNWAYNQTLRTDMPCGLCNALELADEYRMNYSSIMEASDKLIKDQLLKIGGTGLLISLGTLFNPVGIPARPAGWHTACKARHTKALQFHRRQWKPPSRA